MDNILNKFTKGKTFLNIANVSLITKNYGVVNIKKAMGKLVLTIQVTSISQGIFVHNQIEGLNVTSNTRYGNLGKSSLCEGRKYPVSRDLSLLKYSTNIVHRCFNNVKILPTDVDSLYSCQASFSKVILLQLTHRDDIIRADSY